VLGPVLYPLFRRVDFRGKGRLRRRLRVPEQGTRVVSFPGGVRLRLDLRESLQRDFYFGLADQRELALVAERLRRGGDFVDVGAHIGMYSVRAALELRGRGRVLAFEPNPSARAQLEENLRLNGCGNVIVLDSAVGDEVGEAVLHVPTSPDPSFSSLEGGRFDEAEPVVVPLVTVDQAVAEHGIAPSVVKIDVEGREVAVVRGMTETITDCRPTLLVEVSDESAPEVRRLCAGYCGFSVGRRLEPLETGRGLFNALFIPDDPM